MQLKKSAGPQNGKTTRLLQATVMPTSTAIVLNETFGGFFITNLSRQISDEQLGFALLFVTMSFGYSVGDLVAAAGLVRKAVGLLDGFAETSLNGLRIGIRDLQHRVEFLGQIWIQSSARTPSHTTLTSIKQLTDKLAELIKSLERSEKKWATRKAQMLQTEKIQSLFRETKDLIDFIEHNMNFEEIASKIDIKTDIKTVTK